MLNRGDHIHMFVCYLDFTELWKPSLLNTQYKLSIRIKSRIIDHEKNKFMSSVVKVKMQTLKSLYLCLHRIFIEVTTLVKYLIPPTFIANNETVLVKI
jgi:hypothetical protein